MNRRVQQVIFIVMMMFFMSSTPVMAIEVPGYIKDPQDIKDNMEEIIKYNTPDNSTAEKAKESTNQSNIQINQYIASLYAKAIVTRAEMIGTEAAPSKSKNGGALGALGGVGGAIAGMAQKLDSLFEGLAATDKAAILQQEVKDPAKNIANSVNKIVEIEAEIANLQAIMQLNEIVREQSTQTQTEEE